MSTDLKDTPTNTDNNTGLYYAGWTGNAKLWKVFWLINVCGYFLTVIILVASGEFLYETTNSRVLTEIYSASLLSLYLIYTCVSLWRCSSNTKYSAISIATKTWAFVFPVFVISHYIYMA